MVIGLSVGCEIWPPIGWHHPFVICWSRYRLGLSQLQCIVGPHDQLEFHLFSRSLTFPLPRAPCTALMEGKCLPLGLCKETVKLSISKGITNCVQKCIQGSKKKKPELFWFWDKNSRIKLDSLRARAYAHIRWTVHTPSVQFCARIRTYAEEFNLIELSRPALIFHPIKCVCEGHAQPTDI